MDRLVLLPVQPFHLSVPEIVLPFSTVPVSVIFSVTGTSFSPPPVFSSMIFAWLVHASENAGGELDEPSGLTPTRRRQAQIARPAPNDGNFPPGGGGKSPKLSALRWWHE